MVLEQVAPAWTLCYDSVEHVLARLTTDISQVPIARFATKKANSS